MDQSQYRSLLQEVRQDIANAENTIKQLQSLEDYILSKLQGDGGTSPLPKLKAEQPERKSSMNHRPTRNETPEPASSGGGMQTVEFGPDGFPST